MSQWRCLAGVAIKPLPPEHPAAPQHGLFASESIPCGALVGNYTGLVKPQQGADSSHYLVEVHDRHTGLRFDLDAEHYGNETRFINDYKGVADHPNVALVLYHAHATGELSVGVVTQRQLQHGEEILVDYGRQFWRSPGNSPDPSAPGSPVRGA
jgi:SET domain-containing protein